MRNCVKNTAAIILKGRDNLENIDVDAMIILKWVLKNKLGRWKLDL